MSAFNDRPALWPSLAHQSMHQGCRTSIEMPLGTAGGRMTRVCILKARPTCVPCVHISKNLSRTQVDAMRGKQWKDVLRTAVCSCSLHSTLSIGRDSEVQRCETEFSCKEVGPGTAVLQLSVMNCVGREVVCSGEANLSKHVPIFTTTIKKSRRRAR